MGRVGDDAAPRAILTGPGRGRRRCDSIGERILRCNTKPPGGTICSGDGNFASLGKKPRSATVFRCGALCVCAVCHVRRGHACSEGTSRGMGQKHDEVSDASLAYGARGSRGADIVWGRFFRFSSDDPGPASGRWVRPADRSRARDHADGGARLDHVDDHE